MKLTRTQINVTTQHCQNAGAYLAFCALMQARDAVHHFGTDSAEADEAEVLHARALQLTLDFAEFRTANILTATAKS